MRNVWVSGLAVFVLAATACSVQIGSGAGAAPPPRRAAAPPPPAPPPPPPAARPAPPPPGVPRAGFGAHSAPAGAVAATPAPAPAQPQQTRPGGSLGMTNTSLTQAAYNVAKLQEMRSRNPKSCGVQEVAPGAWVRIDCQLYQPSSKAIAHFSPRKALAVAQKKTLWKPFGKLSVSQKATFMSKRLPGGLSAGRGGGLDKAVGGGGGGGDIIGENIPGTVDHRADNLEGPVKSQGPVGSCTAFSLSAAIDNAAIRAGKLQPNTGEGAASPSHVWSAYGYPQMGVAADSNVGRSIAPLSVFAQDNRETCKLASAMAGEDCGSAFDPPVVAASWRSDPGLVAKVDNANAVGGYKIASFERLETQPPKVDELVSILASGSDLWIAMKIDGAAWSNSQMIRQSGGVIPNWTRTEGGHAVLMSGYRDTPSGRQYLIHNSWGLSWGDKGYAWVNEEMVVKYMHYAYRVKLSDGVKKDDITDDDCAPDELVDVGLGICGLICPNGERPSNGCGLVH